jgi:hypothetical protein
MCWEKYLLAIGDCMYTNTLACILYSFAAVVIIYISYSLLNVV